MEIMKKSGQSQLVRLNGRLVFLWEGIPAVQIEISRNPFHAGNCYLQLQLLGADFPPRALFPLLRSQVGSPLQIMVSPVDPLVPLLVAGGFQLRRLCYEMEVSHTDLKVPVEECLPLTAVKAGMDGYIDCCKVLYGCYHKTHAAISPLTASESVFSACLPENAIYQIEDGRILHVAFVEENEIAYLGTENLKAFPAFARTLLARQFRQFETLCFECDDCDPAAMALKSLFNAAEKDSTGTYIFV